MEALRIERKWRMKLWFELSETSEKLIAGTDFGYQPGIWVELIHMRLMSQLYYRRYILALVHDFALKAYLSRKVEEEYNQYVLTLREEKCKTNQ